MSPTRSLHWRTACDCSLEEIEPSIGPFQDLLGADGSVSCWFSGAAVLLMDWLGRDEAEYRALSSISGSIVRASPAGSLKLPGLLASLL